jgi:hypothetical protein
LKWPPKSEDEGAGKRRCKIRREENVGARVNGAMEWNKNRKSKQLEYNRRMRKISDSRTVMFPKVLGKE